MALWRLVRHQRRLLLGMGPSQARRGAVPRPRALGALSSFGLEIFQALRLCVVGRCKRHCRAQVRKNHSSRVPRPISEWYGAPKAQPNVGLKMSAEEVAAGILYCEREDLPKGKRMRGVADPAMFATVIRSLHCRENGQARLCLSRKPAISARIALGKSVGGLRCDHA